MFIEDLGGIKKRKNKSADEIRRGFDVICVSVLLIDHSQQPMKMHTEVTLYNYLYLWHNVTLISFNYIFYLCRSVITQGNWTLVTVSP